MAVLSNTGIRGGASGVVASDPYNVKRSARFNNGDSSYLNWTPAAAGNRKTWTWSGWVKRSLTGTNDDMFKVNGAAAVATNLQLMFHNSDFISVDYGGAYYLKTDALYRDVSAWYHIVLAVDTTQATDTNRMKLYVNGSQVTSFDQTNYPTQNDDLAINSFANHLIGGPNYFDGFITDVHFIDGSAKAASDFAETDSTTGQWVPKEYEGTYGTNGFHLAMDPANSGTNYSGSAVDAVGGSMQNGGTPYIIDMSPADAQFQYYTNTNGAYNIFNGLLDGSAAGQVYCSDLNETNVWTFDLRDEGTITSVKLYAIGGSAYGSTPAGNDWEATLLDSSKSAISGSNVTLSHNAYMWFTVPVNGTPRYLKFTQLTGDGPLWLQGIQVNGKNLVNHGSIGYDSSGNKNHWHENNLFGHEATVANENFKAVKYEGTGSSQTINCGFQPDFVWIKTRSASGNHFTFDSIRTATKVIYTNSTAAESTEAQTLTAFTSTGFTVGTDNSTNQSGVTFVAWCWKAGGAASSNSDGAITSSVSANTTAGFSVVKWTGNRSNTTVGHGLGKALKLLIVKNLDIATGNWIVSHAGLPGSTTHILLNDTGAAGTASSPWNSTDPTSSVFHLGADTETNGDGDEMIAYCWSEIEGHSKFGEYTGNGSSTGPVVDCGFTPGFVLIKRTSSTNDWTIYDTARDSIGSASQELYPNTSGAEWGSGPIDINANGFQIKNTHTHLNASGDTYMYAAFAGSPQGDLDLLADVPGTPYDNELNGGGNYCTYNPLHTDSGNNTCAALSNGNLRAVKASGDWQVAVGTMRVSSGKWYWENTVEGTGNLDNCMIGVTKYTSWGQSTAFYYSPDVYVYYPDGASKWNGNSQVSYGSAAVAGDIIGTALDMDNGKITFYKNGISLGDAYTGMSGSFAPLWGVGGTADTAVTNVNFGQREFAYTPPSGFKTLNTYNLPDPTIVKGNTGFEALTFTGTGDGNGNQKIVFPFSPDMVWTKRRDGTANHALYDIVRGTNSKLYPSTNAAANTGSSAGPASWDSDGVTLDDAGDDVVYYGASGVAWAWDAGTANVTNDASSTGVGTIDSTYRVNTNTGFSIVKWTDANGAQTIAHGLNAKPNLILLKDLGSTVNWSVYHSSLGNAKALYLNTDAAAFSSSRWNSTDPTSSVFSWNDNTSTNDQIAYCWSEVAGYSKFGTYTGNASANGTFTWCGFRPAFVMLKRSDAANYSWLIHDATRDIDNVVSSRLMADTSAAEGTNVDAIDLLSNGFKIRTDDVTWNSSAVYIFAAFAESPFKYSNAR